MEEKKLVFDSQFQAYYQAVKEVATLAVDKSGGSNKKAREYLRLQLSITADKQYHELMMKAIKFLENLALSY